MTKRSDTYVFHYNDRHNPIFYNPYVSDMEQLSEYLWECANLEPSKISIFDSDGKDRRLDAVRFFLRKNADLFNGVEHKQDWGCVSLVPYMITAIEAEQIIYK